MKQDVEKLIEEAIKIRERAYAPYSKFAVGAAISTEKGIICACNVENSSYGLSCCAERNAVFKAISEGCKRMDAIALVTDNYNGASPCGACRQVLNEFNPEIDVIMSDTKKNYRTMKLSKLLPDSFGPDKLTKTK